MKGNDLKSFLIIKFMAVYVLKLGHRIHRDYRLDTHLALAARAFLADKLYYSGQKDSKFEDNINKVTKKFGGSFCVDFISNHLNFIKHFNGKKVHLTMYGIEIKNKIKELKQFDELLIIVGGEKVPPNIYQISDYNISVTNQPHSEVSALALFLDKYFEDKRINNNFGNPNILIVPNEKGKTVIKSK